MEWRVWRWWGWILNKQILELLLQVYFYSNNKYECQKNYSNRLYLVVELKYKENS